ncbi:hypothetical protein [Bifidobacterium phasiani]|uniref:Uncharacterized protein n=1 Tax=Bifidobacterium phasiani TaxID=2834431 RepID=A0ABS6W690_9BIFI|nr:hypothetical protein [Bifidobacterium phasiani]MBW3081994.1 hypothetical protein [Bifidobacterium phasiani]
MTQDDQLRVEMDAGTADHILNHLEGRTLQVAIGFDVRHDGLDLETGEVTDTVVRVDVDPDSRYPDPQAVALVWWASQRRIYFPDEFARLKADLEHDAGDRIQEIVRAHPDVFGDVETVMRFVFARPARVLHAPPMSVCRRCGTPLWPTVTGRQPPEVTARLLSERPSPAWCRRCGQRFAYDKAGNLKSEDSTNVRIMATRLMDTDDQPPLPGV